MNLLTPGEIKSMVDAVNELANATLLKIASPGALARNGDPTGFVTVWQGEAVGELDRSLKETTTDGREHPAKTVTFHIYDAVAPGEELAGAVWNATTVVIRDETRATPTTSRWTVAGAVKETEHTLDGITLELQGETTP